MFKRIEDHSEGDVLDVLGVDFLGAFFFTQQAFLKMRSPGAIVNVSSIHAVETTPLVAAYAAAKAALLSLTRSAAIEGRERGIRVNAVLPGAIETPMLRSNPNLRSGAEVLDPSRIGRPEDVAAAIAWLASGDAAFVDGAGLRVDGGRLDRLWPALCHNRAPVARSCAGKFAGPIVGRDHRPGTGLCRPRGGCRAAAAVLRDRRPRGSEGGDGRFRPHPRSPQYFSRSFVYPNVDTALSQTRSPMDEQNRRLAEVIAREQGRLGSFIRRRVADLGDAEDILQDVMFELVETWRLPDPIEQVGAWLFRVARNRIVDRFRKKREQPLDGLAGDDEEGGHWLEQALPSVDDGPEAAFARAALLQAVSVALDELPATQRDVFIAHELQGLSFKDLAAQSGVNVNTLLGWKRRAVLHLRSRLQPLYDELL